MWTLNKNEGFSEIFLFEIFVLFARSQDHDEIFVKAAPIGESVINVGYVDGVVYIGSWGKSGKHLSYAWNNSSKRFSATALTAGNFNVNGTLRSYTANATLIDVAWNAAQQYVVWRASDNE